MPRSVENYVQEIGRSGRDGTLARCHMFLTNQDFYQLRRITLSDLLDQQSALRLTNICVLEAKRQLHRELTGEPIASKRKRKKTQIENSDTEEEVIHEQILEDFEHEADLQEFYGETDENGMKFITVDQVPKIKDKALYLALHVKDILKTLDLKKEVVLTMLNQMEKLPGNKSMFKINSILPSSIQMRFHSKTLEDLA